MVADDGAMRKPEVPVALVPMLLMLALVPALFGCPPPAGAEGCASPSECEEPEAPACERCPRVARSLCLEGGCVARPADAVDVTATIVLDRAIDQDVGGLVWALAAADRTCTDVGSFDVFPADLNVLAAGQKSLSGGAFHPDVPLARAPEGALLVLALATSAAAGEGEVLGAGCAEATATAPSLAVAQLDLAP